MTFLWCNTALIALTQGLWQRFNSLVLSLRFTLSIFSSHTQLFSIITSLSFMWQTTLAQFQICTNSSQPTSKLRRGCGTLPAHFSVNSSLRNIFFFFLQHNSGWQLSLWDRFSPSLKLLLKEVFNLSWAITQSVGFNSLNWIHENLFKTVYM